MMNIEQVLDYYKPEIGFLFRKYNLIGGVNMETIKKGHSRHGERFMMDLLEIITPEDSDFTNLFTTDNPFTQNIINAQKQAVSQQDVSAAQGGKFWGFWDKLLTGIDKTGQTIDNFKQNVSGAGSQYNQVQPMSVNPDRSKTILMIAGGLALIIVAILIFKK